MLSSGSAVSTVRADSRHFGEVHDRRPVASEAAYVPGLPCSRHPHQGRITIIFNNDINQIQGHFPRLPQCIKEAFVKKKKINKRDQARVLHRLNTVIERRIAKLASEFSPRIKQINIKNGVVSLIVFGKKFELFESWQKSP